MLVSWRYSWLMHIMRQNCSCLFAEECSNGHVVKDVLCVDDEMEDQCTIDSKINES